MAGLVEGKVALVTGAGGGIGRASAENFVREGARGVVVVDVKKDGGDETVAGIRSAGGDAHYLDADVSDEDSWRARSRSPRRWCGSARTPRRS